MYCLQVSNDHEEELGSAASFLIREWVEKLLGVKFDSLRDLALYLVSISHQSLFYCDSYRKLDSFNC